MTEPCKNAQTLIRIQGFDLRLIPRLLMVQIQIAHARLIEMGSRVYIMI